MPVNNNATGIDPLQYLMQERARRQQQRQQAQTTDQINMTNGLQLLKALKMGGPTDFSASMGDDLLGSAAGESMLSDNLLFGSSLGDDLLGSAAGESMLSGGGGSETLLGGSGGDLLGGSEGGLSGFSSLGPIAAIAAAVAASKAVEANQGNSAFGKVLGSLNAPSGAQIMKDPKLGVTTAFGLPFLNGFIRNDEAANAKPEWQTLFGF